MRLIGIPGRESDVDPRLLRFSGNQFHRPLKSQYPGVNSGRQSNGAAEELYESPMAVARLRDDLPDIGSKRQSAERVRDRRVNARDAGQVVSEKSLENLELLMKVGLLL